MHHESGILNESSTVDVVNPETDSEGVRGRCKCGRATTCSRKQVCPLVGGDRWVIGCNRKGVCLPHLTNPDIMGGILGDYDSYFAHVSDTEGANCPVTVTESALGGATS